MNNTPIITREVVVKSVNTGIFRSLLIEIGRPYFNEEKNNYECLTNYGWLFALIPIDKQKYFHKCEGVDPVDAMARALDMLFLFELIDDLFEFSLPNGDGLTTDDQFDLQASRFRAIDFAELKRKDERFTNKKHHYLSLIECFEQACEEYRERLREDEVDH